MISIITPTLNAAGSIESLLGSLKNVAGRYEHIVVDGGSSDATVAIAEQYGSLIVDAPGSSIYEAQNIGLSHASGDWVYFIGADDTIVSLSEPSGFYGLVWGKLIEHLDTPMHSQRQQSILYPRAVFPEGGIPITHPVYSDVVFRNGLLRSGVQYIRVDDVFAKIGMAGFSSRYKHG